MSITGGFSNTGCNQSTGSSAASTTAQDSINEIYQRAATTFAAGRAYAQSLIDYSTGSPSINVNFSTDGELVNFQEQSRPRDDFSLLDFDESGLTEPGLPSLENVSELDAIANFPLFESCVMANLATQLCGILSGTIVKGLPLSYERAVFAKSRDQIHGQATTAKWQIVGVQSRAGWSTRSGYEDSLCDGVDLNAFRQISALSGAITMQMHGEALADYRNAIQQANGYLAAWVQAYSAYVSAQSQRENLNIRINEQRLEELQVKIAIFQAQIQQELARLGATQQVYATDAQLYQSDIGYADALARVDQADFEQDTRERDLAAVDDIESDRANAASRRSDIIEGTENLRAQCDLHRQVIAALYQMMNFSVGLSSSVTQSNGKDCNTSYAYRETVNTQV